MTCAEFQRVLPYIIDTGGNAEQEEHLRHCPVCADLVADLKYIADQAKLLVPMEDPSPRVWEGLQKSLEREGLVKSAPARRSLLGLPLGDWEWFAAGAVIAMLLAGIYLTHNKPPADQSTNPQVAAIADSDLTSSEDQEILSNVAQLPPDVRDTYKQGLHDVNSYIRDAERSVRENPNDDGARQLLMRAYQQKALLYRMASRSGQ
ncbi:MAG: hypothetical protein ROO76_15525 [Terriglobia bacterium]|jgi:hypothetical protein|nr:hypothetical protein [Terriglobia bacterium]